MCVRPDCVCVQIKIRQFIAIVLGVKYAAFRAALIPANTLPVPTPAPPAIRYCS
jgi:hypothetical protein